MEQVIRLSENRKKEIEERLRKSCYLFSPYTVDNVESIKTYLPVFDDEVEDRKNEIQRLYYEMQLLEKEKELRTKKLNDLNKEKVKTIIVIDEHKRKSRHDEYGLRLSLMNISEKTNFKIKMLGFKKLSFKERVSARNEQLLDWIRENFIDEIHSNVNIDKFIKENNLEIKVIEVE